MPRFIGDHTCVNCGKDEKIVFDVPRVVQPEQEKPAEPPKVKMIIPRYVPKVPCADGNCNWPGGLHLNDNYNIRPKKKCTNCDQFAPEYARKCPWCGNDGEDAFDTLDDDELDELGIPKPTGAHNHDD